MARILGVWPDLGIGRAGVNKGSDLADILLPDCTCITSLCEFSVLVRAGDFFERSGPLTSTVWLKRLDRCYMAGIESLEPVRPNSIEALFFVFDRKLRTILNAPGIETR